jgi:hypothetical protein
LPRSVRIIGAASSSGDDDCGLTSDRWRSERGGQKRDEVSHRVVDIGRITSTTREGFDPLRAARRVVDRAEHEVEAPQHVVGGQLRQALAQRGDEGLA